jgi:hypothetical protein
MLCDLKALGVRPWALTRGLTPFPKLNKTGVGSDRLSDSFRRARSLLGHRPPGHGPATTSRADCQRPGLASVHKTASAPLELPGL